MCPESSDSERNDNDYDFDEWGLSVHVFVVVWGRWQWRES